MRVECIQLVGVGQFEREKQRNPDERIKDKRTVKNKKWYNCSGQAWTSSPCPWTIGSWLPPCLPSPVQLLFSLKCCLIFLYPLFHLALSSSKCPTAVNYHQNKIWRSLVGPWHNMSPIYFLSVIPKHSSMRPLSDWFAQSSNHNLNCFFLPHILIFLKLDRTSPTCSGWIALCT